MFRTPVRNMPKSSKQSPNKTYILSETCLRCQLCSDRKSNTAASGGRDVLASNDQTEQRQPTTQRDTDIALKTPNTTQTQATVDKKVTPKSKEANDFPTKLFPEQQRKQQHQPERSRLQPKSPSTTHPRQRIGSNIGWKREKATRQTN